MNKINLGQFFTKGDWLHAAVASQLKSSGCVGCVDPFAGAGDMLRRANEHLGWETCGYDIDQSLGWTVRDGLKLVEVPDGYAVITNPPYLAKNSAKRKGLSSYDYFACEPWADDLYRIAMRRCLDKAGWVCAVLPESELMDPMEPGRLRTVAVLPAGVFEDTLHPVAVFLWAPTITDDVAVYDGDHIRSLNDIVRVHRELCESKSRLSIRFNVPDGNIGLRCIDTSIPAIGFVQADTIDPATIKVHTRNLTRLMVEPEPDQAVLDVANGIIDSYRERTGSLLLAPFKNEMKNGLRRRRMQFELARGILNRAFAGQDKL